MFKEFLKNEWQLFLQDMESIGNAVLSLFSRREEPLMIAAAPEAIEEPVVQEYVPDEVDYKVETYFGENICELKESFCGDRTQHEVLRDYAQFFKPYGENAEMCQTAFKKYYDRHALKMAVNEFPIEQARIIQNNVDLFIEGQEVFGENGQFIDSRVDGIFEKVGMEKVSKMVSILGEADDNGINYQGERTFAEAICHMVDNGIKVNKDGDLVNPVRKALEEKLNMVHASLRSHEDWNDDYQALLSQERKYLYALNRIEQFETEERIAEFESKLNELDVVV
jgi:hypothetical protein